MGKLVFLLLFLSSAAVNAVQLMALDIKAIPPVPKSVAQSLTSLLITELSNRQGLSVVSQYEITGLLNHEANKQALGCDDDQCLNEIAGSMGSELLLISKLSLVGKDYHLSLSLLSVSNAEVLLRSSVSHPKNSENTINLIKKAVMALFSKAMPSSIKGPDYLSKRGFKALTLGIHNDLMKGGANSKRLRKRIIFDLLNTELDFDLKPKQRILVGQIRKSLKQVRKEMLYSKNSKEFKLYVYAENQLISLDDDYVRSLEIRKRAEKRGLKPNVGAIRFEDSEITPSLTKKEVQKYLLKTGKARGGLQKVLKNLPNAKKVKKYFHKECGGFIKSLQKYFKQRSCDPIPKHAIPPYAFRDAFKESFKVENKLKIYFRCRSKDRTIIYGKYKAEFEKVDGKWTIFKMGHHACYPRKK